MKKLTTFRYAFQLVTFIFFIIQFQQSVRKYFSYPVVEQTSRVSVADLPVPVVYVCQVDQYNYTKSRDLPVYTTFMPIQFLFFSYQIHLVPYSYLQMQ